MISCSCLSFVPPPPVLLFFQPGLRRSLQYWLSLACPVCGEFFSLFKISPSPSGMEEKMALRKHARENHGLLHCDIYDLFSLPPNELCVPNGRLEHLMKTTLTSWVGKQQALSKRLHGDITIPSQIVNTSVVQRIIGLINDASKVRAHSLRSFCTVQLDPKSNIFPFLLLLAGVFAAK